MKFNARFEDPREGNPYLAEDVLECVLITSAKIENP